MLAFPPEIKTERLILRPIRCTDAEFVYSYACDPEIVRYVAWPSPQSIKDTIGYLTQAEKAWDTGEWFEYLIISQSDGAAVGAISAVPDQHSITIGYVVARPQWGKGFASEAASAVVNSALAFPEVQRVWTVCDTAHSASARVLEKAGMKLEGALRKWKIRPNLDAGRPRDCYCYARVKET